MMNTLQILCFCAAAVLGYGLGSISSAVIVSRCMFHQDIRDYGSGNAGMTNVFRVYGKLPALYTLIGDLSKSALAVILTKLLCHFVGGYAVKSPGYLCAACVAALFVIIGHIWPLYFGFRGGKGVLTTLGVWLFIDPWVALACLLFFLVICLTTRYVSLGSVLGMAFFSLLNLTVGLLGAYSNMWPPFVVSTIIALMSIFMHRKNIARLCKGTESKLGSHSKKKMK